MAEALELPTKLSRRTDSFRDAEIEKRFRLYLELEALRKYEASLGEGIVLNDDDSLGVEEALQIIEFFVLKEKLRGCRTRKASVTPLSQQKRVEV